MKSRQCSNVETSACVFTCFIENSGFGSSVRRNQSVITTPRYSTGDFNVGSMAE